jgi:hypothetical protein
MKRFVIAQSQKWELREGHVPKSGSSISIPGIAPPALPISDSALARGTHD